MITRPPVLSLPEDVSLDFVEYLQALEKWTIDVYNQLRFKIRIEEKGEDVASANDLRLSRDASYFDITGTTTINGIATDGFKEGQQVTLQFDASVTVSHNTAASAGFASILLSGAGNMSATADDTLTLVFDGTTWREVARTII